MVLPGIRAESFYVGGLVHHRNQPGSIRGAADYLNMAETRITEEQFVQIMQGANANIRDTANAIHPIVQGANANDRTTEVALLNEVINANANCRATEIV